jgi:hypothetical protein
VAVGVLVSPANTYKLLPVLLIVEGSGGGGVAVRTQYKHVFTMGAVIITG